MFDAININKADNGIIQSSLQLKKTLGKDGKAPVQIEAYQGVQFKLSLRGHCVVDWLNLLTNQRPAVAHQANAQV